MSSSLDPDAIEIVPQRHNEYGPSDTSDSASDVLGSDAQEADTATGTGERSSVESVAPSETEQDIVPDKVISPAQGSDEGASDEEDEDEVEEAERT